MTFGRLIVVVMCACGASSTHVATPEQFVVRLHRPVALGARWHIVTDGTLRESKSTYTEQVVVKKSEKRASAHLDATATALLVEDGVPSRIDYVIAAFEEDGKPVVAAGKHVIVSTTAKKEDARIEVDGQPASTEVRDAVDVVLSLTRDQESEDLIFGTARPQPIGGSWDVAIEPTKAVLARNGAIAKDDAIAGRVTLAGKERVGNEDCLDVRVALHIKAFTPTAPLPEGSTITKGSVALDVLYVLPLDTSHGARRGELDVHTEFEAFVPVQSAEVAGVTVETRSDRHRSMSYAPITP